MKLIRPILLVITLAVISATGCKTNEIQVIDGRTGQALPGAEVYRTAGGARTGSTYTDYTGSTPDPGLGTYHGDIAVTRPGYEGRVVRP